MKLLRQSFRNRLVLLVVALVWVAQSVTLFTVLVTTKQNVLTRERAELSSGARILPELLATRTEHLRTTVRALVSDLAFREAVSIGDKTSIHAALQNQRLRARADIVSLISIDGREVSTAADDASLSLRLPFSELVARAARDGYLLTNLVTSAALYEAVLVPVHAPRIIGWVLMGFALDDVQATQLHTLTGMHVSFVALPDVQPFTVVSSTLVGSARATLANSPPVVFAAGGASQTQLGKEQFLSVRHPLNSTSGAAYVILHRSLDEALVPFQKLRAKLLLLFGAVSALAVLVAFYMSASVTRPIAQLVKATKGIGEGNYDAELPARREDEFGLFAATFDQMRADVADREARIVRQAHYDELTGLPNRVLGRQRLQEALTQADTAGHQVCVIMLSLERFAELYGSLGHAVGDVVAKEIARRLEVRVAATDTVARCDGDRFMIVANGVPSYGIRALVETIVDTVTRSVDLRTARVTLGANIGVALYPEHGRRCDELMQRADIAMHDARKSQVTFSQYEPGRDEGYLRRLAIVGEVEQAASQAQFELLYQPKINTASGAVPQVEALIRWHHPVHGLLLPDEFIPALEDSGNITVLTKWVLETAIAQCRTWRDDGIEVNVCVNLSSLDLADPKLVPRLLQMLADYDVSPDRLVAELTESTIMRDAGQAHAALRQLRAVGVKVAVDDFGIGYSSLAKIKSLAIDELKIDKSFVLNVANNRNDAVIVQAIIELGHNMGFEVTAEGVESDVACKLLTDYGCDQLQGYFFSRPISAGELATWLKQFERQRSEAANLLNFRRV